MQQLEQQIQKAEFDYQTQLTSNQQTIDNFVATTKNIAKDIELLYGTVSTEADKLLGITLTYDRLNDSYEQRLGAKNTQTKRDAEQQLRILLANEAGYTKIYSTINEDNLQRSLEALKLLGKGLQPVLDTLDTMLSFTETSPRNLPASQLG